MPVIDSLEFAQTGQKLSGTVRISQLARLQDSLFDGVGELSYELNGGHDARRRPVLMLEVSGVLHLQCQRCLALLNHPLRLSNVLLLGEPGEAAGGFDPDEAEWIEASRTLDVAEFVEDEILLGLPYSPRHAEGLCRYGTAAPAAGDARGSAFGKLAVLKRNDN